MYKADKRILKNVLQAEEVILYGHKLTGEPGVYSLRDTDVHFISEFNMGDYHGTHKAFTIKLRDPIAGAQLYTLQPTANWALLADANFLLTGTMIYNPKEALEILQKGVEVRYPDQLKRAIWLCERLVEAHQRAGKFIQSLQS